MEWLFRQKNFFLVAGFIILGVKKKMNIFRLISIEKVKNYLLIQKDNSLTFYATKKKGTFFKICHFLITGRVVLHKKFYKKISSTSYQKWKDYLGKKNFFLVAGFIILGVKKWTFFRLISIEKVKNYLLIQKDNSLTFLCDKRRERFFQNLSLFDNWSCSTTQEIL